MYFYDLSIVNQVLSFSTYHFREDMVARWHHESWLRTLQKAYVHDKSKFETFKTILVFVGYAKVIH